MSASNSDALQPSERLVPKPEHLARWIATDQSKEASHGVSVGGNLERPMPRVGLESSSLGHVPRLSSTGRLPGTASTVRNGANSLSRPGATTLTELLRIRHTLQTVTAPITDRKIVSWRSSAVRISTECCSQTRVEPSTSVNGNVDIPVGRVAIARA